MHFVGIGTSPAIVVTVITMDIFGSLAALLEHPSVAESAVVSSPDEVRGEVVKAFIVLKVGYQPSEKLVKEIQDHAKKVTAPYKYPRKIEFVSSLPKTVSGKIRRMELREKERGQ
jgi:acyl-coenzyme A synthetase/AMP-(fatty) acid ligase